MTHLSSFGRNLFKLAFITVLALGIQSCTGNKTDDPEKVADSANDANFDNKDQENDAKFLADVAEANMTEVGLSRVALQKSTSADIKALAQMMIDDHTASLQAVTDLAAKKGVTIPTAMTDDADKSIKDLNEKTGEDLDDEYADKMVKNHKNAIDLFEKRAEKSEDGDIKTFASGMLPKLRTHLEHAQAAQDKHK